jgi:hypothetical protein
MASRTSQTALERRALSRLRQLLNEPGLLRASWVEMKHRCGKNGCRCNQGKRYRHVSWYVSQSKRGKPRMKSVPADQVEEVGRWIERYQEARELLAAVGDEYWNKVGRKK